MCSYLSGACIYGLGGIGKTSLVIRVCEQLKYEHGDHCSLYNIHLAYVKQEIWSPNKV